MQYTPYSFLWSIIKPYKWWYLLMVQAPIVSAFFPLLYNYAIKLLIDLFTQKAVLSYSEAFYPILYFIGAQVIHETGWRLNNFANWHTQPYVRKEIICKPE